MTVQETKIEKNIHALLTWDIGANINYTWQEMLEHREAAIEALKEVEQYRALGTVEELKEAKEKQIPKKVIIRHTKNINGDVISTNYYCPICDELLREEFDEYCPTCGKALKWGEEE